MLVMGFLLCHITEFDTYPMRIRTPLKGCMPISGLIKSESKKNHW